MEAGGPVVAAGDVPGGAAIAKAAASAHGRRDSLVLPLVRRPRDTHCRGGGIWKILYSEADAQPKLDHSGPKAFRLTSLVRPPNP